MEFQFSQHSTGEVICLVVIGLLTLAAAGIVVVAQHGKGKKADVIVFGGGAVILVGLLLAAFGGFRSSVQTMTKDQTAFSQQLMDEYHVKMNRSPGDVLGELSKKGVSDVVFTRDGKDTPVLIRRVDSKDDAYKMTLEFIDLGDKSLYPKP